MITSIAIDPFYVYTLVSGVINRTQLNTNKASGPYVTPTHASPVAQIMTSNEWLYALHDDGLVFRLYQGESSWEPYLVPAGTTYISSNDTHVFTISASRMYRRGFNSKSFEELDFDARLVDVNQIDHDEELGYAQTNGLIYFKKFPSGSWTLYTEPLANVIEVTAGIDFVYAATADGSVWRSKVVGHSGWEKMGGFNGVTTIAVPSDHTDEMWATDGVTLAVKEPNNWVSNEPPKGWIVADWITQDWIEVA